MAERGNIILVPKGTLVKKQDGGEYRVRKDLIRVVDYAHDDGELSWEQPSAPGDWRYVATAAVRVLDSGNHQLTVGRRRVRGGGWGGWAASYMTDGRCACGEEFNKRSDAREVREYHREHVLGIAEEAMGGV